MILIIMNLTISNKLKSFDKDLMAEWKEGKLTVWTGTQRPFGVQQNLAELFRIAKEKVRVIMPDTGSGYGASRMPRFPREHE